MNQSKNSEQRREPLKFRLVLHRVVKRDKDGNPENDLRIDGCQSSDEKVVGKYLQSLAQKTDTHGQYEHVGEVYGFPIAIISERVLDEGKEKVQNRFVVEGNYKYKFNNGYIAMSDTHAACMNFVNALEKIPGIIAQYEERSAKLKADVPTLEGIMSKKWGKDDELKQLKSDLAALDRKIQAEIVPKQKADGVENKKTEANSIDAPSIEEKKSLVAEPNYFYNQGCISRSLHY